MKVVISDYVYIISINAKEDKSIFSFISKFPKEEVPNFLRYYFEKRINKLINPSEQWYVGSLIDANFPNCEEVCYVATCLPFAPSLLQEVFCFVVKGCIDKTLCGGSVRRVVDCPYEYPSQPLEVFGEHDEDCGENWNNEDNEWDERENDWEKGDYDWGDDDDSVACGYKDKEEQSLRLYKLKAFSDIFMLKTSKKSHDKVYEIGDKFYLFSECTGLIEFFETAPVELIIGKSPIGNLSDILKKCKETNDRQG